MSHAVLTPAYGKDYKSKAEVEAALLAGKDFIKQPEGAYINLEGLIKYGLFAVNVRYNKNMSVHVIADVRKLKAKAEKPAVMFGVFLWKQSGHFEASEALYSYKSKASANKKAEKLNADGCADYVVREFTPAPKAVAMPRSRLNRSALADILDRDPEGSNEPMGLGYMQGRKGF